jgi:hypothetical protein
LTGQQGRDIELRFAVGAVVACYGIPAKKTIDTNDFGLFPAETIELFFVNDEKMIADFVETTGESFDAVAKAMIAADTDAAIRAFGAALLDAVSSN